MFYRILIFILLGLLLAEAIAFLYFFRRQFRKKRNALFQRYNLLEREEQKVRKEVDNGEHLLAERFLFYDTARKTAPLFDQNKLLEVFVEELKYLGPIKTAELIDSSVQGDFFKFELDRDAKKSLCVKTDSKSVLEHIPSFVKLLRLCLERIKLYNKLQELSIYDSLTKCYNRRYFMLRYMEEFERAKKFGLKFSFLMIDIDNFKKINDTYGHLVGDAILREIAKMIRASIRQIDFIARFGGEEFSVVLTDTDKTGAIMVAERINSRISRHPVKVFDELLSVNISIGVAAFPENAIHSDVLIEIADKALYKAKISGRNRASWF